MWAYVLLCWWQNRWLPVVTRGYPWLLMCAGAGGVCVMAAVPVSGAVGTCAAAGGEEGAGAVPRGRGKGWSAA